MSKVALSVFSQKDTKVLADQESDSCPVLPVAASAIPSAIDVQRELHRIDQV